MGTQGTGNRKINEHYQIKSHSVDWRLLGGFVALLLLIIGIGIIGILQIQSLSESVDKLGKRHLPVQKAILEMKISNSLYARGIRSYIYWQNFRYLEAAATATNLEAIHAAAVEFERHLSVYSSHIQSVQQRQWVERLTSSQQELRNIGDRIIDLVGQMNQAKVRPARVKLEETINKLMMLFEDKLYKIDDFLDGTVQASNLEAIKGQLLQTYMQKRQATLFLGGALIFCVLIGGQTTWLVYRDRRRARERREQLTRRMIKIEEEERENLSFQVHDQMGQDLSALKIYLGFIERGLAGGNSEVKERIAHSKDILSGLLTKSHNISELLRPPALDEVGLVDTIGALISQYHQMTGYRYTYQKPKADIKLSGEYSLALYRVAQEGLTNIAKHSQAKNVEIKLNVYGETVQLSIQDDGRGFDYKHFLKERLKRNKLGLGGLQERIELLDGRMSVDTAPGEGTRLTIWLPLRRARA